MSEPEAQAIRTKSFSRGELLVAGEGGCSSGGQLLEHAGGNNIVADDFSGDHFGAVGGGVGEHHGHVRRR